MGGKVWSDPEECIFWVVLRIAPPGLHWLSRAVKKALKDIKKSWQPVVAEMVRRMREMFPGQDLPRNYTAVSLYEHYFQNFVQGKLSPNAGPHVEKYKAWLKEKAENPESGSDNEESESSQPSVSESSKAKESEPTETSVSIPTSAISQQGAGQQSTYETPPPPNCGSSTSRNWNLDELKQGYYKEFGPDSVSSDHGSEERPGKRSRVMNSGHHGINMSAPRALPNQHGMPAEQDSNVGDQFAGFSPAHMIFQNQNRMHEQQNVNGGDQFAGFSPAHMGFQNHNGVQPGSNNQSSFLAEQNTVGGGQLRQFMPIMQGPPPNNWHQLNMGATYPGPTTGQHGAQNSTNLLIDHNDTQVNYRDFTGPGLLQNDTNSFISHGAARPSHSTVNGHSGAQKRKHPGL